MVNHIKFTFATFAVLMLQACSTNPVTGQSELALVSTQEEIALGEQHYVPGRQSQGGDYVADPSLVKYVDRVGQKLAKHADRKLPYEFSVINNSTPNAWALPGGKIAINRGLLVKLKSEAELAAVLSHEIVHAAARHGAKAMQRGMLLQVLVVATAVASQGDDNAGLKVLGSQVGAALLSQKYSRDAELESDHYGMQYMDQAGYDASAAVDLQKLFVELSQGKQSNWLAGMFASHPPSQERVQKNRETAAKLGAGGLRNEQAFRQSTAYLRKVQPAYDAYDSGVKAVKEEKWQEVKQLARKAISIEPNEGHFYALYALYLEHIKQPEKAVEQLDTAIAKSPNYFLFYLQRGRLHNLLGHKAQAKADLTTSQKLLPTQQAKQLLGSLGVKSQ